jgi:hypothetical protein
LLLTTAIKTIHNLGVRTVATRKHSCFLDIAMRYSEDIETMETCRRRLNSTVATFLIHKGGYYIHYPDIKPSRIFLEDGVHLTNLGNECF